MRSVVCNIAFKTEAIGIVLRPQECAFAQVCDYEVLHKMYALVHFRSVNGVYTHVIACLRTALLPLVKKGGSFELLGGVEPPAPTQLELN